MLSAIISDLKLQIPEIFNHTTEEQFSELLQPIVETYLKSRELPKASNWTQRTVNRVIKRNIKLPRKPMPKRDKLPYVAPEEKECTKCLELKPIAQFNRVSGKHQSYCAKCAYVLYQRPAVLRRLERRGKKPRALMTFKSEEQKKIEARERTRAWSKANRDKRNAAKRARRALKNPPIVKIKVEKPIKVPKVKLTPEQLRANRKEQKRLYRLNNPEKVAAERTKYLAKAKACPQFRARKNLRKRLKEFLGPGTKIGSFSGMVGCTKEELVNHLESQFQEGMSWNNYGEWHIDHIKPLAAFDLTDATSRKEANHFTNLRPLWKRENEEKNSYWNGVRYEKGKPMTD